MVIVGLFGFGKIILLNIIGGLDCFLDGEVFVGG